MLGTPFAYNKFRGGLTSAFVGYELSYTDQRVGISDSRGKWPLAWIAEARSTGFVVSVRRFSEFLGRLGFVARLLVWLKPHLAPVYSWRAALSDSTVARLSDVVIMTLEYLSLTLKDMSFKVSASRPVRKGGVAFRTDAKCTDGLVVLGRMGVLWSGCAGKMVQHKGGPRRCSLLIRQGGKEPVGLSIGRTVSNHCCLVHLRTPRAARDAQIHDCGAEGRDRQPIKRKPCQEGEYHKVAAPDHQHAVVPSSHESEPSTQLGMEAEG